MNFGQSAEQGSLTALETKSSGFTGTLTLTVVTTG
jgi:hypothetical protein